MKTKKKFLYCNNCKKERWTVNVSGPIYRCVKCDSEINAIYAKRRSRDNPPPKHPIIDRSTKKSLRELRPDYIRWIKGWECLACKKWPVDAHHTISRGALGSDLTCVPLCHMCHMELHNIGQISFQKKKNLDFAREVKVLNTLFQSGHCSKYSHIVP